MAKYYGKIGYATQSEIRPGVYEDVIVERSYFGTVTKNSVRWSTGEHLHKDFFISNVVSVVSDPYLEQNLQNIRYVEWMGAFWSISDIDVERPRIDIRLGGVYNGPTASVSTT